MPTDSPTTATTATNASWHDVCVLDDIVPDTGVCALLDGAQVAVFRLRDDTVHAVGNVDPFSGAPCLSRGIVGDAGGVPKVAAPVYKQSFDLRSGVCLDDPAVSVPAYAVRVVDGRIQVGCEQL
jgi:nitrite reductase (NADH) small subunit